MNIVIVRKSNHQTEWFFDATVRLVGTAHNLLVCGRFDNRHKFLAREWVEYEVRKIDPDTWTEEDDAALLVEAWIYEERQIHAGSKYGRGTRPRQALIEDTGKRPNLGPDSAWYTFITNYLSRAGKLGVHRLEGAQAAAKLATTAIHHLETVQLVYGSIPAPGDTTDGANPWTAPARLEQARRQGGVEVG